ncbi:MAG: OmpA family protein [Acidobacteriota bacterium]|nr:MAG: OmpA family protein [Acidobacteriota bacterium]
MSDSKKPPKNLPPDDYSKTTPNIDIHDDESDDWDNTPYNAASEAPADDWGKTVINYNSSLEDKGRDEYDDTYKGSGSAEQPDWGMTQANINLGEAFEAGDDDFGGEDVDTGVTKHVIHIPELDRKKFQIPPTPTEKIEEERKEKRKQGGIPAWFWVTAGLMTMFFFALIVIVGVYFLFLRGGGYEVVVQGAPIGSRFHIDNEGSWGVASTKNEHVLSGLDAGNRTIEIRNPGWQCEPIKVNLEGGINPRPIIASCRRSDAGNTMSEAACDQTRVVEDRERCAEQILDTLGDPPDLDRLIKALNWLIINFESGKWDIPEPRKRILTKAASHMKKLPDTVTIEIGGHTDDRGSDADNQALSDRRANAVKDFLVNVGTVRPTILTTKGYGESKPKATNDTEDGRFDNRRIEYTVVKR